MTDDDRFDRDDELLARLRAGDPAAALPPADPDRVARLLEETMNNQTEAGPTETGVSTESRETGTRNRGPLTWLVAAAAVLLIAGVGLFGLLNHDFGTTQPPSADKPKLTHSELQAPGQQAYTARCMVPSARILSTQTVAFEGTVEDIADDTVTLTPTHWYHGNSTGLVTVTAPPADLAALVGAAEFKVGGRYLVSATDGEVTVCGMTAPYNKDLAALYAEAFDR